MPRRRSGAGGTAAAKPFCSYSDDRFSGSGTGNLFVASNPGIDHVFHGGTGQRAASASASALRPDREMSH